MFTSDTASSGETGCRLVTVTRPSVLTCLTITKPAARLSSSNTASIGASRKLRISPPSCRVMPPSPSALPLRLGAVLVVAGRVVDCAAAWVAAWVAA